MHAPLWIRGALNNSDCKPLGIGLGPKELAGAEQDDMESKKLSYNVYWSMYILLLFLHTIGVIRYFRRKIGRY